MQNECLVTLSVVAAGSTGWLLTCFIETAALCRISGAASLPLRKVMNDLHAQAAISPSELGQMEEQLQVLGSL